MIPVRLVAVAVAATLLVGAGWYARGVVADRDHRELVEDLRKKQDDQRELTAKVEAADTKNTAESTARIDAQEEAQRVEVKYVDREVIRYVRSPDAGKCHLPDQWVHLYNRAAGLPDGVPEASAARATTDGGSSTP